MKVADEAPAATVTDAGTVAAETLEVRVTVNPPVGAALLMVTVPTEPAGASTVAGLSDSPVTDCAATMPGRSRATSNSRSLIGRLVVLLGVGRTISTEMSVFPFKYSCVSVGMRTAGATPCMNVLAKVNFTD